MSNNSPNFPFDASKVDDDSLRLMTISERAALATDRILKWGTIKDLTHEEWMLRIKGEIERVTVETIVSCAMLLEQRFPDELENRENGELIGGATASYLRTNMDTIVAGIDIEEDYSISDHREENN